ncbi:MAG TPA: calcium-binding protein [Solirubrobacterales bacterium]|nr:calcium-binding protein [Solirubrobacterales bacterium]
MALTALLVAAVPASAGAVTVTATETVPVKGGPEALLDVQASPEEANRLSVTASGVGPYVFEVRDNAEPSVAGPGCSGGGAPGTPVTCPLSTLPTLTVVLGNGGSFLDSRSLPPLVPTNVIGGSGDDTILTANGGDQVQGGMGTDVVRTAGGDDSVFAPPAADGPDLYDLGAGALDLVSYQARSQPISYQQGGGANDGAPGERDTVLGAEAAVGGAASDALIGAVEGEYLLGAGGDDTLVGEGSDDVLAGDLGAGSDQVGQQRLARLGLSAAATAAAIGNDTAYGGPGEDFVRGDAGDDKLYGIADNDVVVGNDGNDLVNGGPGDNRLYGQQGDDKVVGREGDDLLNGSAGVDGLFGSDGEDKLVGGSEGDRLFANRGPDRAFGMVGDDLVNGGPGSDRLYGNDGDDKVVGRWADDLLNGGAGEDGAFGGPGSDKLLGRAGDNRLFGNQGPDRLFGGEGFSFLNGGPGSDRCRLGPGGGEEVRCNP